MKEQILKLRKEGKTYKEIVEKVGCSKGTVAYHCGKGVKEKSKKRLIKLRKGNSLISKTDSFKNKCKSTLIEKNRDYQNNRSLRKRGKVKFIFGVKDVIEKVGNNPICYLTGRKIDLTKPRSFHFDHIIPVGKGGISTLDNLGIACRDVNVSKSDLMVEDYLKLCKEVLEYNGYIVNKIEE